MQTKPGDWNDDAPVTFYAEMDPQGWAIGDRDVAGFVPIGSVSVERDLTGGGLPGNVRGASGISSASGSLTARWNQTGAWSPFGAPSIQAGGPCRLWAFPSDSPPVSRNRGEAIPADMDAEQRQVAMRDPMAGLRYVRTSQAIPLASMKVSSLSGSLGALEGSASLVDRVPGLNTKFTGDLVTFGDTTSYDASFVIAEAARLAGFSPYHETPAGASTNLYGEYVRAPLMGTVVPSSGLLVSAASPRWANRDGMQWYEGGALTYAVASPNETPSATTSRTMYFEVEFDGGGVKLTAGDLVAVVTPTALRTQIGATTAELVLPAGQVLSGRVLGVVSLLSNAQLTISLGYTFADTFQVANTSVQVTPASSSLPPTSVTIEPVGGGIRDAAVKLGGISSRGSFSEPSNVAAKIEYANSPLRGVFGLAGRTCWDVIQEIATATMGAAWIDESGMFIYRSRESLRGGAATEVVQADQQFEDIPWTLTDDESADRVVVSYTPAAVNSSPQSTITVWEATSPVSVGARSTTTITQDIETATDTVASFSAVWSDSGDPSGLKGSKWAASPSRDGSGTRPADNALVISGKMLTPFRMQLTIQNTTNSALWLVDGSGSPFLVARTSRQIEPGESETVEWGESEDAAVAPFQFDAGQWVQDATTANEMLTWLVSQFQAQQPTLDKVTVKPDLARQLGDIVMLVEEQRTQEHDPLRAKGLITGISLSGSAGEITQTLNIALLADVFRDLDAWCQTAGVNTFDQLDAALTAANVTTFDQFDTWAATTLVDY